MCVEFAYRNYISAEKVHYHPRTLRSDSGRSSFLALCPIKIMSRFCSSKRHCNDRWEWSDVEQERKRNWLITSTKLAACHQIFMGESNKVSVRFLKKHVIHTQFDSYTQSDSCAIQNRWKMSSSWQQSAKTKRLGKQAGTHIKSGTIIQIYMVRFKLVI